MGKRSIPKFCLAAAGLVVIAWSLLATGPSTFPEPVWSRTDSLPIGFSSSGRWVFARSPGTSAEWDDDLLAINVADGSTAFRLGNPGGEMRRLLTWTTLPDDRVAVTFARPEREATESDRPPPPRHLAVFRWDPASGGSLTEHPLPRPPVENAEVDVSRIYWDQESNTVQVGMSHAGTDSGKSDTGQWSVSLEAHTLEPLGKPTQSICRPPRSIQSFVSEQAVPNGGEWSNPFWPTVVPGPEPSVRHVTAAWVQQGRSRKLGGFWFGTTHSYGVRGWRLSDDGAKILADFKHEFSSWHRPAWVGLGDWSDPAGFLPMPSPRHHYLSQDGQLLLISDRWKAAFSLYDL